MASNQNVAPIDLTLDETGDNKPNATPSKPCFVDYVLRGLQHDSAKLQSSREANRSQIKSGSHNIIDLDSDDDQPLLQKYAQTNADKSGVSMPHRQRESIGLDQSVPRKRARLDDGQPQATRNVNTSPKARSPVPQASPPKVAATIVSSAQRGPPSTQDSKPLVMAALSKRSPLPTAQTSAQGLSRSSKTKASAHATTTSRGAPIPPTMANSGNNTDGKTSTKSGSSISAEESPVKKQHQSNDKGATTKKTTSAAPQPRSGTPNFKTNAPKSKDMATSSTDHLAAHPIELAANLDTESAQHTRRTLDRIAQDSPRDSIDASDLDQPLFVTMSAMSVEKTMESVIKQQLHDLRTDTIHTVRTQLRRARMTNQPSPAKTSPAAAGVFAKLKPLKCKVVPSKYKTKTSLLIDTESWTSDAAKSTKKSLDVPWSKHNLKETTRIPKYSHVVRLRESMLAPNNILLNVWPYFGDEASPDHDTFNEHYAVDVNARPDKLLELHTAQWLYEAAEIALMDAVLSWSDVLGYLFSEKQALPSLPSIDRDVLRGFEFPADSARWIACNNDIGTLDKSTKAAHFCAAFFRLTDLSPWHVLRRSQLIRDYFAGTKRQNAELAKRECRVCYRFDCDLHGTMKQLFKSKMTKSKDVGDTDTRDIVNPPEMNLHKRICFEVPDTVEENSSMQRKVAKYWETKDAAGKFYRKPDDMAPYFPCNHPHKSCVEAECSCAKASLPCSKYCTCPLTCARKFQGCLCAKGTSNRICFKDDRCACYQMGRECDADVCGGCGVQEVLDMSKDSSQLTRLCRNASLQRGSPKHTLLGDSTVHELGLYACEHIFKDDFIGEYKGEVLTKHEADRRGAIYEHQKLSYLFTLNEKQEVDSTYCGNKIRFINHDAAELRNVYAMIMLVNTVHRIGLWAERQITPGEELFFDYGSQFPSEQLGGKKPNKAVPKARNMATVDGPARPKNSKAKKKKHKASADDYDPQIPAGERQKMFQTDNGTNDAGSAAGFRSE